MQIYLKKNPRKFEEEGRSAKLKALLEREPTGHAAIIQAITPTAKHVKKIVASIHRHRGLLSVVRHIPCEVWQKVFCFTTANFPVCHHQYGKTLHTLCSVSRMWNLAATTEQSLWTVLPNMGSDSSQMHHASQLECLALYLERSGSLPIDVEYASHKCALTYTIRAQGVVTNLCPILAILIKESHRWKLASFDVVEKDFQHLEFVEGRIPCLETLSICVYPSKYAERTEVLAVLMSSKAFSVAPSLRHVDFTKTAAPWNSLISFPQPPSWFSLESLSFAAGFDIHSIYVIHLSQETLRSLDIALDNKFHSFCIATGLPIVLPRLKKLVLHIDPTTPASLLRATLSLLVLPALEELGIMFIAEPYTPSEFAPILSATLGGWKSLKRLRLDPCFDFDDALPLLDRCPELEALDIQAPNSTSAGSLFQVEPTALPPLMRHPHLPLLQTLTLHTCSYEGDDALTESQFSLLCKSEACSLGFMIMSRTVFIPGGISPQTPQLKTINFIWDDSEVSKIWHAQLEALNDYLPDTNGGGLPSVSLKVVDEFREGLRAL
ncbi:hypothetical protein DFP72DRAFT_1177577 [Ephemerocybe angulata]|uniref:F-box domain-containing protein n=1 Tax=Ephemerocybe angulata TaxID=980116 RepID=A0A8H6HCZ1_9AGAR|nr:hypothetical protein DFP72DRAFT_1177577 [Tulosesus angulatus]